MGFSSGKHALGDCDRCGFTYKLNKLQKESGTKFKVCPECFDGAYDLVNHPQNYSAKTVVDNEALRDPRPARTEPPIS